MDVPSEDENSRSASSRPSPKDLTSFLPYACFQLEAHFSLKVNIVVQDDYQRAEDKPKKGRRMLAATAVSETQEPEPEGASPQVEDESPIVLTVVVDTHGRLVELIFCRCVEIPRLLIKVIGFCLPYQPHFNRLTVRWGPLTTAGLYEFSKYLDMSKLSEIILDDSPVAGRNYEVLLAQPSNLRCLSLARCKLDDDDCHKIASMLKHPLPAAKTLSILSLVSNRIGDKGASFLGQTLRSNRTLKYLNLAGNYITDVGANFILNSLMEFVVTQEEILEKKARYLEYLKYKNEVYNRCIKELNQDRSHDEVRMPRRRAVMRAARKNSLNAAVSTADAMFMRAEAMTIERVGTYNDPFSREFTTPRNGQLYCVGNLCLTCLNLSYNNLQYGSVELLCDVLMYQSWLSPKASTGLLRINIEGNDMPLECDEWAHIDELLERAQVVKAKPGKRTNDKAKARPSKL